MKGSLKYEYELPDVSEEFDTYYEVNESKNQYLLVEGKTKAILPVSSPADYLVIEGEFGFIDGKPVSVARLVPLYKHCNFILTNREKPNIKLQERSDLSAYCGSEVLASTSFVPSFKLVMEGMYASPYTLKRYTLEDETLVFVRLKYISTSLRIKVDEKWYRIEVDKLVDSDSPVSLYTPQNVYGFAVLGSTKKVMPINEGGSS